MDYRRKKHWVKYQSDKCKMYLRNDFRFECAYCGMRERDNMIGEMGFEKDHFISRLSTVERDLDTYDNMVYSCCKCNNTKSDQQVELYLDPCKDDIYGGNRPHIKKTGMENHYKLQAVTKEGQIFIDTLQLNSRFYRKMREKQLQNDKIRKEIYDLIDKKSAQALPNEVGRLIESFENRSYMDEETDEFRCGVSKAGEGLYKVLEKLNNKRINYRLVFDDNDLDVIINLNSNTYYCEVKVSDYNGTQRRGPHIDNEKRKVWLSTGDKCGVLYYYKNADIMELYVYGEEENVDKFVL